MKKLLVIVYILVSGVFTHAQTPALKFIIYDFDGLNIGQTNLPDGDYRNNDLTYEVVATPLINSDVLGDRVLKMKINWSKGKGEFGKSLARFIDLDADADYLNFYFYNPLSNRNDSLLQVFITEDDNSNDVYEYLTDDKWTDTIIMQKDPGWQLISLPLSSFVDENPGGNGIFDAGYAGTGSMLFTVGFVFYHTSAAAVSEHYYIDMISFSEGPFPTGATIFDLPQKDPSDHCQLGALVNNDFPDTTPDTINSLFSAYKLKYVNWFINYAETGTTANVFPGNEVSTLLNNEYAPVITWEMMYEAFPRLDPMQPRLDKILDGTFDAYIDDFADQVKTYGNTIILRIFHEFEGNWYSWSLAENNSDPETYIAAWQYVVNRFRARGVNNVQWMWCVNAEPKPYIDYNWIVDAYPGNAYVDIVGTDIYNHPNLGVPDWKSFRYTMAESYHYLTKHFPSKPFYICEVASRERYPGEPVSSQSKAEWLCQMNKDLQSYFCKTRALIFFSVVKEHDWRINSSAGALNAVTSCIWNNSYFGGSTSTGEIVESPALNAFPNPFSEEIIIETENLPYSGGDHEIRIYDLFGKIVFEKTVRMNQTIRTGKSLAPGVYIIELQKGTLSKKIKVVKVSK